MLLASQIVGLLALLDQVIGIASIVIFYFDFGSWRKVAYETPFFAQNHGVMTFLQITFAVFLATGLLEFLASCSNNRVLWWFSLIGKGVLLGCSVAVGIYFYRNNMRSEEFLEEQFKALVLKYKSSKPVGYLIDWIHQTHECCGFRSDHAEWETIIGKNMVPDSCCVPPQQDNCGVNNQEGWLIRINNAACQKVMWQAYKDWDPEALLLYLVLVYIMWLGVIFIFYKVFLASYLAAEVAKYLRSMDTLNE